MNERNEILEFIYKNKINISDIRNLDTKLDFIRDVYGETDKNNLINTIRRFNQFGKIENKFKKDFIHFDTIKKNNAFIEFFKSFPWGRNTFNASKCLIKSYLDWARDNKLIDEKPIEELERINYDMIPREKMYETYYFRTFDELQEEVEQFRQNKKNTDKMLKFHMAEIVIYLAWCGIQYKDVHTMRKDDVNEEDKTIYIKRTGEVIKIDENQELFDAIIDYKNENYKNYSGYVESDYLIRSDTQEKLDPIYLRVFLSRFFGDNEYNTYEGKVINYNKVYWSGIYSRARIDEMENGEFKPSDIERIVAVFKEDYSKLKAPYNAACTRLISYNDYMKYLFPTEILGYDC